MSDQASTSPPSRWYVPLSLYRDNAVALAKAPAALGVKVFGAMMMRPVHWPPVCVVCAAASPTETDEVTWMQDVVEYGEHAINVFKRNDVPICARCKEIKNAGNRASALPDMFI